jgi:hypothetical protein
MSPLPHDYLPINTITNILLSISIYNDPYITRPTRSVTNQFHYQYYAFHLTLKSPLYHPYPTIIYQSIPLPIFCYPSHTLLILISPHSYDELPINSITNVMLSISHCNHPNVNPPTRSVTNQFHY